MVERKVVDIPLEKIENLDSTFFRQVQMNQEKAMRKFKGAYEETKKNIFDNIKMKGLYQSFKIIEKNEENIVLEGGKILQSRKLAEAFEKSEELVLCAVTLSGYDPLETKENDNVTMLFLDGWGTAISECGHVWIKGQLKKELEKEGVYCTCSWSPGQFHVDIRLQEVLFELLKPEEIGIELNKSFMMHPKKSISSFIGIGKDPNIDLIRACDFCEYRDTCPDAYV